MDPDKPVKENLRILEEQADALQKQAKYGESLDILEQILNLKRQQYGEESEEYFKTSEKLCELCNVISMICLQKEKYDACLDFLKKAEFLSQNSFNYKAITFNNMACYYRRKNKLRIALQYLQKALSIELKLENPQSLADTHLNLCAVLSQLDRHQEALEHVLLSIVSLQDEYMEMKTSQPKEENSKEDDDIIQEQGEKKAQNKQEDRIAVLAIAYHNLGVEFEYLKRFEEAIQTYQKAVKFAKLNLGENHTLVENLKNVLASAQQQIDNQKGKDGKKRENLQNNKKIMKVSGLYAQQSDKRTAKSQGANWGGQSGLKSPSGGTTYGKQSSNNNRIQYRPQINEPDNDVQQEDMNQIQYGDNSNQEQQDQE